MTEQEYKEKVLEFLRNRYPNANFSFDTALVLNTDMKGGFTVDLNEVFIKSNQNNFSNWQDELFRHFIIESALISIKNKQFSENKKEEIKINTQNWSECQNKIYPILKRKEVVEKNQFLVHKHFFENIHICWVLDLPSLFQYVTDNNLLTWGIAMDELDKVSRRNLEINCESKKIRAKGSSGKPPSQLIWDCKPDGLTASRILIRNFYSLFSQHLGQQFYIAIPERDFFAAYRIGGDIDFLKEDIKRIYNESPYYMLCDKLILVDNGKFSFVE